MVRGLSSENHPDNMVKKRSEDFHQVFQDIRAAAEKPLTKFIRNRVTEQYMNMLNMTYIPLERRDAALGPIEGSHRDMEGERYA